MQNIFMAIRLSHRTTKFGEHQLRHFEKEKRG